MRHCVAEPLISLREGHHLQMDRCLLTINLRISLRWCLEGPLLLAERNKTLAALANAAPIFGVQAPVVLRLQ